MSNQDDLHKHLADPKTIKQAAEGSMEKRQELIDRVSNTTDAEFGLLKADIINSVANDYFDSLKNEPKLLKASFEKAREYVLKLATEDVEAILLRERVDELKRMWNGTQPDIVPEGWQPETEEGKYLQKRIKELKSS